MSRKIAKMRNETNRFTSTQSAIFLTGRAWVGLCLSCRTKREKRVCYLYSAISIKPRLHERFFACDGDAIFLKIVASPARGENRMCSHPRTGDATDEKIAEKNREKFNELNFLRLNHGLVRGWLHRRFSPRAGDATISKKSHHHRKQKIARVAAA